jgi:hypothetical protein
MDDSREEKVPQLDCRLVTGQEPLADGTYDTKQQHHPALSAVCQAESFMRERFSEGGTLLDSLELSGNKTTECMVLALALTENNVPMSYDEFVKQLTASASDV